MASDPSTGDDQVSRLLAGTVRVVSGAVAAAFVPHVDTDSPVVWATLGYADLATELSAIAGEHLRNDGPWGNNPSSAHGRWVVWVEPVLGVSGAEDDAGAGEESAVVVPVGALAIARRDRSFGHEDVETLRFFARLCGSATRARHRTGEVVHQRRVDDLVSRISERLMSTTLPTLQGNLDWTVETLCQFLRADFAFLRRNDHAAGTSVLIAEYPRREVAPDPDPLGVVPFDADPIFGATRDLKVPIVIRDVATVDENYTARVEEATGGIGNFTGAGVPLVHAEVTEGILAFAYISDFGWSESEVNALRAVAALLVQLLHRIDAEERLRRSALTDDLTGLPNRRALLAEVESRSGRGGQLALLFLDLDRFKVMNDHLGHGAGDTVLRVIADRISTSLRPSDFAARLGGDEFVVLIEGSGSGLGAVAAAHRLLDVISRPIDVGGQSVAHTGTIGVAVTDAETSSGEGLLGKADMALYAAKSRGRNRIVVFDGELQANVARRSSTELLLRKALSEDELEVFYQPEFDLRCGRLLAVEALVRWQRPDHGLIAASEFIPVAEETHLITDIDRWMLQEACMQMARWQRTLLDRDMVVRVNISPAQLAVAGIVQAVDQSLRRSGLPPEMLCLEITEQAMIADVEQAVQVLQGVRALGVKLAIDDFGTGFSSMMQLRHLPVDTLKIDRVFVDGIASHPTDQAIVDSIVRLGRAFDLELVAEGVEARADLDALLRLGCERAQGFLLARPQPAGEIEPLLRRGGIDLANLGVAASAVASAI